MRKILILLAASATLISLNAHAINRGELLGSTCMSCHGPAGKSQGAIPNLAGLDKDFFVKAMKDFKSGARMGTVMKRHAAGFTDGEYEAMGAYFANLKQ